MSLGAMIVAIYVAPTVLILVAAGVRYVRETRRENREREQAVERFFDDVDRYRRTWTGTR